MPLTISDATVTRISLNLVGGQAVTAAADYTVTDDSGTIWSKTYTWELAAADVTNIGQLLPTLVTEMETATGLTVTIGQPAA